jgi:dihydroorotate dehydrogenase (NAD+) catalytic subunit
VLRNPVMTASGTAGHDAELGGYFDLASLGAIVIKSLSAEPWAGNPAPRLYETTGGMLNSVGLQNPGVETWLEHELPELRATGATVVASIWGFTIEAYEKAATMLAGVDGLAAVEVNVSCPNVEDRRRMFAHSASATAEVISAASRASLPRWAKLSPNVTDLVEIASAAMGAGADALTLINTVMGMAIDPATRRPRLGAGGGGLSGGAIRPVAVRAVYECRAALPDAPIVGVGGVSRGEDAVELLLAGANAVQVGTATFANPRAPARVLAELDKWCRRHGVTKISDLTGAAHA